MTLPPNVYDAEPIPETARAEIDRMLKSGDLFRYTAPENAPVTLLEREFAALMGSKYALAVSSCSAALFLSLKALDLPRDARVLIPGFTFAAVPSSVVHAECVPVLCEVGDNYRIDIQDFEAKLGDGISAVIISHMRGHTSDMDAVMTLCEARGIPVIEDAAHSLGTTWDGRNIGTIGTIGCFSFQSYKLVNAGVQIYASGLDQDLEFDADLRGVVLAARAGYDPFALLDVLATIDSISPEDEALFVMLRTHPPTGERLEILAENMDGEMDDYADGRVNRKRFREMSSAP